MSTSASLSLSMPKSTMTERSSIISSTITTSPTSHPGSNLPSPNRTAAQTRDTSPPKQLDLHGPSRPSENRPTSPTLTSLPPFPSSAKDTPKHARESSKGFFANLKASKSSNKVHHVEPTYRSSNKFQQSELATKSSNKGQQVEPTIRQVSEEISRSKAGFQENSVYLRKSPGSTPDLSLSSFEISSNEGQGQKAQGHRIPRRPVPAPVLSDSVIGGKRGEALHSKKTKPRFGNLISRTRSIRLDDGRRSKPATPISASAPHSWMQYDGPDESIDDMEGGPRTAPLQQDRSLRDMMSSNIRNRSADRQSRGERSQDRSQDRSQESLSMRRPEKAPGSGVTASTSVSFREGPGSHLFTNIKATSTKAADGLGKAGKGIFAKMNRSGSSNAKEDDRYVLNTINLPLKEQTRKTRIAFRLEDSKDKTEFWMPALPWRCIDYLNSRGCEEEGLYRVPGSDVQIRHWQKRFDQEGDIDLFNEDDLYDINIIGSMFKAWLRELPTEILPKATQATIAQECAGAKEVPQLLKDELSSLPPWNYYILFAITCHLSLLIAYADKNKMTYNNLCICFQPALKIDAFCFQFLVQRWRECWQGCWTEHKELENEYRILDGLPSSSGGSSAGSTAIGEDRSLASSASNRPTISSRPQQHRPPPLSLTKPSEERLSTPPSNGNVTPVSQLPELAPVQPLSPLGL